MARVLQHGPMDVLGVLAGLMFVKDVENLADELATCILTDILRDRDQFDAELPQLTHVEFGVQRIAAETTQGMNDDIIERPLDPRRFKDHLLEGGAIVVERRGPGLRENLGHLPTALFAIGAALGDLIGK
ncbi:hypothetical protein [Hyphomicrobium sp. ghe19]|uniref:hypothetical protein n=1 Tax=Hyphomicrobium sp. ghe19 TaxID=2682968 RepID=UPI0030D252CB